MSDDFKNFAGTLPCTEHNYWNGAVCPFCARDREIASLKSELESTKAELTASRLSAGNQIETYVIVTDGLKNERQKLQKEIEKLEHEVDAAEAKSLEFYCEKELLQAELEETRKRLKTVEYERFDAYDRGYKAGVDDDKELDSAVVELQAELNAAKKNAAFYKSCALSGEQPEGGDEPCPPTPSEVSDT